MQNELKPTSEQQKIINFILANPGKNVGIAAVPGAGKTTLFSMLAKEYARQGVNLTVLTFSKSLADEMASKIDGQTSTTHALMYNALKSYATNKLNKRPQMAKDTEGKWFRQYVKTDLLSYEVHRMLRREYGIDKAEIPGDIRKELFIRQFSIIDAVNKIRSQALNYKSQQELIAQRYTEMYGVGTVSDALTALGILSEKFFQKVQVDFMGMLYLPFVHKELHPYIQSPRVLGIDEANDSFPILREVYKIIARQTETVIISGDAHQTIHIWAGTESDTMSIMQKEWDATVLSYEETFRVPNVMCEYLNSSQIDTRIKPYQHRDGEIREISYNQMLNEVRPGDAIIGRWNRGKRKNTLESVSLDLLKLRKKVALVGSTYLEDIREMIALSLNPNVYPFKAKSKADTTLLDNVKQQVANTIAQERIDRGLSHGEDNWKTENLKKKFATFALYYEFYVKYKFAPHTVKSFLSFLEKMYSSPDEAVQLISIHRSKGKEYENVYGLHIDEVVADVNDTKLTLEQRIEAHNLLLVLFSRSKNKFSAVDSKMPAFLPPPTAVVEQA